MNKQSRSNTLHTSTPAQREPAWPRDLRECEGGGFRVSGIRVQGSGFRVQGSGFRVHPRVQGWGSQELRAMCLRASGYSTFPHILPTQGEGENPLRR